MHTDITTCNTDEPQQKYRLGMVSNRLLGGRGGGLKLVLLDQRALSIKPFSDGKPVWGTHADPFHMPLSAASDQGLYRLLIGISM